LGEYFVSWDREAAEKGYNEWLNRAEEEQKKDITFKCLTCIFRHERYTKGTRLDHCEAYETECVPAVLRCQFTADELINIKNASLGGNGRLILVPPNAKVIIEYEYKPSFSFPIFSFSNPPDSI
jgi:hypothetical protein